jgi:hypothetical protein
LGASLERATIAVFRSSDDNTRSASENQGGPPGIFAHSAHRRLAMVVKLRKPSEAPAENGANGPAPETIQLAPLAISAVCISKAALLDVLRPYLPGISGIEIIEDRENGERFLLTIAPGPDGAARGVPTP